MESPAVDAIADKRGLTIRTRGTIRLRLKADGINLHGIGSSQWSLPGLHVNVTSDASGFSTLPSSKPDQVDLIYSGIRQIRLEIYPDTAIEARDK